MGIFCTVRAFMRFRGREALRDTYKKHGGSRLLLTRNQIIGEYPDRIPRNKSAGRAYYLAGGGSCIAIDAGTNSPLGDNTAQSAGKRFCRAERRHLQRQVKALGLQELMGGLQELMEGTPAWR